MAQRTDPYSSFNFLVELDGVEIGGFSEVLGIKYETETEEFREGGINDFTHKLPKITKYGNLTLKRGMTDTADLYDWYRHVIAGIIEQKKISVIQLDHPRQNEIKRWDFLNAYPVKWVGSDLKADGSSLSIETIEFAHQGIELVK